MTRAQLADLREQFAEERRNIMLKRISALQKKLYTAILDKVLDQLEMNDGKIISNGKNIDVASALNKIYKEFRNNEYSGVIKNFAAELLQIQSLNESYFATIENDNDKLKKVSREVNSMMRKRIGIGTKGDVVKDGFLDKLISDETLLNKVKNQTYRAITGGDDIVKFKKKLSTEIIGNDKVNGGLVRHFNTFAYDTYTQFDRTASKLYAGKLGLQCFIYAGGKIKTSRPFCVERNGRVYTTDEAEKWKSLDFQGKPENYQPLIDCGGYNCRHHINYISNALAIRMRPDLQSQLT